LRPARRFGGRRWRWWSAGDAGGEDEDDEADEESSASMARPVEYWHWQWLTGWPAGSV